MSGPTKPRLMQGNEACAEGALAAGVRFFAGYPITPSTEIAEILAERLPLLGGKFIQMEDEIASMAAVIGASLAGVKAITATSGPGFSLKQENIGFAAMAEVPCVVVNVQRTGPSTGVPTAAGQGDVLQARWGTHGDHPVIALCPSCVRETFELTVTAVNLSEKYRVPVILLMDEVIAHMREKVELPSPGEIKVIDRKKPRTPPEKFVPYQPDADGVPPMANFGEGYRYHVTGLIHDKMGFPTNKGPEIAGLVTRLTGKIEQNAADIIRWEGLYLEDAEVVVVAYGCVARSAREAVKKLRREGLNVGLFRPVTLWPFPAAEIAKRASRARGLVVAELNLGQLKLEVERASQGKTGVHFVGRIDGELLTPREIIAQVKGVL
ncbi:MAG: 2-oxoacid:acceptor oxidoreductase subunit alpha [Clostridia bacterium]|nr:2-oxoacid:acceptor oxidoreductase subunit alpha [Clostridia bacterium]